MQQHDAILDKKPAACHVHWNWLAGGAENDANAQFAAKALDISRGCRTISSILCQHLVDLSAMQYDGCDRPLLNGNDTEALARLMVVSLEDLCTAADAQVERFNEQARDGVRK
jgi:hypothetical protein